MKQFISFIRKEFFHIFRDRRTMLILLGMPIVQIILFGFAITTEVKNVRVAVLDPSNDVVTRRIIDRMDASEYFTVKPLFIILAKAVPYFVLSFVNLTTILLLSVYVLNVPVAGSLFWLVPASFSPTTLRAGRKPQISVSSITMRAGIMKSL
jgi:hypothetical protein